MRNFRVNPDDILSLRLRNQNGDMIPLGTVLTIEPALGRLLISLSTSIHRRRSSACRPRVLVGDTMALMEEITARTLPTGVGSSWTALSYQEKLVGGQIYFVFALAHAARIPVLAGHMHELVRAGDRAVRGPPFAGGTRCWSSCCCASRSIFTRRSVSCC